MHIEIKRLPTESAPKNLMRLAAEGKTGHTGFIFQIVKGDKGIFRRQMSLNSTFDDVASEAIKTLRSKNLF